MSTLQTLNVKSIRIDGGTQSRVSLDLDAVAEYRAVLAAGGELPPVTLFFDGAEYWLADGFHRYHAYVAEDRAAIPAEAIEGTLRQAVLHSVGANGKHGLRRTNEDKRKAVLLVVADPEWSKWSDREIARQCEVGHPLVAAVRAAHLEEIPDGPNSGTRKVERGGTTFAQDTTNIGKSKGEKIGGSAASGQKVAPMNPKQVAAAARQAEAAAKQAEADKLAEEAHGDGTLAELVDELHADLEAANKLIAAAEADDLKAEAIKWRKIAEMAQREQHEIQGRLVERENELRRQMGWLRRIGKAVGEDNPTKIAATVEAFVRTMRAAA